MLSAKRLKKIQLLKTKKGRLKEKLFLIEGKRSIENYILQSSIDYKKWLSEQETFKELIAKQQKIEFENKKIVKNNNFLLNKEIYKEE